MPPKLTFTTEAWSELRQQSEAAYPFEGCGLLLAALGVGQSVQRVVPLENVLRQEGRGRFDFTFSPQEFARAQMKADRDGLDVVGIYHTHPDHPPRPSATDASQPMLSGWINVIASVRGDGTGKGLFKEAKSWWREDEHQPFTEIEFLTPN